MKRRYHSLIYGLVILLATIFSSTMAFAAAQPFTGACATTGASSSSVILCKSTGGDPLTGGGTLTKVATALEIVAGIMTVIFIIIGGIKYILSGGDSAQISSAKNTIIYALVGLVVVLFTRIIISFVLNKV